MNLSSANIKGDFSIKKATNAKIGGMVKAKGKPMELIYFLGWKQNNIGVRIKIYRDSSAKIIAHAFTSYTRRDRMQIRTRKYHGARKPLKPFLKYGRLPYQFLGGSLESGGRNNYRGPIETLRGPRVEDVFIKPEIFEPVTIQAQTLFVQRIDQEVTELFRKLAATGKT
jgi:hypothetical protein